MIHTLVSLMLVLAQVFSWSAAPLYLCLEADGSTCLDLGPLLCECCRSEEPAQAVHDQACAEHGCQEHGCQEHSCPEHELRTPAEQASAATSFLDGAPCGCTHRQISAAQAATVGRASSSVDTSHSHAALAIIACPQLDGARFTATSLSALYSLAAPTAALVERAGIVMRC
jgi:hypothetical protein